LTGARESQTHFAEPLGERQIHLRTLRDKPVVPCGTLEPGATSKGFGVNDEHVRREQWHSYVFAGIEIRGSPFGKWHLSEHRKVRKRYGVKTLQVVTKSSESLSGTATAVIPLCSS
jgi:hypothetical protein